MLNEIIDEALEESFIKKHLERGLDNGEFSIVFQPQVDSMHEQLIGIEALVRWNNKYLGYVSPSIFIPIAEEKGLIIKLGLLVMEESIKKGRLWHQKGYKYGTISVNVSPFELANPYYLYNLVTLCDQYDFPYHSLELEITEGLDLENIPNGIAIINEIASHGFKVAIDDFGSGYSNLCSVLQINANTIKIDKSIIDVLHEPKTELIVKSIIDFGQNANLNVLAEGVESQEQVDKLRKLGCHLIQGYYYSKPLTHNEIDLYLQGI